MIFFPGLFGGALGSFMCGRQVSGEDGQRRIVIFAQKMKEL